MVDATRDAFDNIDTSLEDVVVTVLFLLVAVARNVSARDALELLGPSRMSQRYSNPPQGCLLHGHSPCQCGCLGYLI